MTEEPHRCSWARSDALVRTYHDEEWGVPQQDSRTLREMLMLEGFQAGLAWIIISRKRGALAKIRATIRGAQIYCEMAERGESFAGYCRSFTDGKPIKNAGRAWIATSPLSETISKDMKKRGFKFVGPTIVYAWMRAVGVVNDHERGCFRRDAVRVA